MKKTPMAACFLDSNVCCGYLIPKHIAHNSCVSLIQNFIQQKYLMCISPLVLDEIIHTIMKDAIIYTKKTRPQALKLAQKSLDIILNLPQLSLINPPHEIEKQSTVIKFMAKYSLKPRDAYHLLTIKHHRIKYFATLDHDFDNVFAKTSLKQFSA